MHRPHSGSAGRRSLMGRVVNSLGQPIDGKGPINATETSPIENIAPGVIARQSVSPAGANRPQVDRRHGADRPRPARTDHWRPPDRQNRRGDRRHHQPEGHRRDVHLRRHRPEGIVASPTWCASWKSTARWVTPSWSPRPLPTRPPCSTSHRTPAAPWANTSATAAKMR